MIKTGAWSGNPQIDRYPDFLNQPVLWERIRAETDGKGIIKRRSLRWILGYYLHVPKKYFYSVLDLFEQAGFCENSPRGVKLLGPEARP